MFNGVDVDVDVVVVVDDDDDDVVDVFSPLNGIDYHDQLGVLIFIMTMGRFHQQSGGISWIC